MEGFYAEKSREPPERTDPLCGGTCLFRQGEHGKVLTAVSEEAAKQNVKEKLENQKKVG